MAVLVSISVVSLKPIRVYAENPVPVESDAKFQPVDSTGAQAVPVKGNINYVAPSPEPAKPLSFSDTPADNEFLSVRLFTEPLLPMGESKTTPAENRALADAILAFSAKADADHIQPLEEFLRSFPESPWRVSLLTNMGFLYRSGGYWSSAFDAWQKAWKLGQNETEQRRKLIVDHALAQATDMAVKFSWTDYIQMFLDAAKDRGVSGPATELLSRAKNGLYLMRKDETKTARCGPLALRRIIAKSDPAKALSDKISEPTPTEIGTTFTQLQEFSKKLGLNYQMAYRTPGAELIVPCLVNWKVGHHSAITAKADECYVVDDITFGRKYAISEKAIDQEASGYFLVPKGKLPPGWRTVSQKEGAKVWGKGDTKPPKTAPPPKKDPCAKNMAQYNVQPSLVNLTISDTPIYYQPPHGPAVDFMVSYSQRDVAFSSVPNYPNLGSKWNLHWVCFIWNDNGTTKSYGPGGGELSYTGSNGTFAIEPETQSILTQTSGTSFVRTFPDGSKQVFGLADNSTPMRVFMTESYDPAGNKLTYTYDPSTFRLLAVTDSMGQVTTLAYVSNTTSDAGFYKVHQVTDPFGRKATLDYNSSGYLQKITDMGGITSEFTYRVSGTVTTDTITKLTTPYGDTLFSSTDTDTDRNLLITVPSGEKECYLLKTEGVTPSDTSDVLPTGSGLLVTSDNLMYRNTFYWDKNAYAKGAGDYNAAKLMHWLHTSDGSAISDVLESVKPANERRIHYNYPGQLNAIYSGSSSQPSMVARVMDDGSTQLTQYEYNACGNVTKKVTPGDATTPSRTTLYQYAANNIDLLAVYQQNSAGLSTVTSGSTTVSADLLQSFTYNDKHLVTSKTDASGQTTNYTYNSFGQVLSVTNPKGETTTYTYDRDQDNDGVTDGYLVQITRPAAGATTQFQYDGLGRVVTVTDSQGYAVNTTYESIDGDPLKTFDRASIITYPDSTTTQFIYNKLDLEWTKDRIGRWSRQVYDSSQRLLYSQDPDGKITNYEWCSCGSLASIIDPEGHQTTWIHDVEGRLTDKIYPDGSGPHYTYEKSTSRIKSVTDALGQVTTYTYNIDDSIRQVAYSNAVHATSGVAYTYDTVYGRVASVASGTETANYRYNSIAAGTLGSGKVAGIDLPNYSVNFTTATGAPGYDQLGRVVSRKIGADNVATTSYDALGRAQIITNPLGRYYYSFFGYTSNVARVVAPNQGRTECSYYDNTGDNRLQTIRNFDPQNNIVSQFDYGYNAVGNITSWTQQNNGGGTVGAYSFGYDGGDEIITATVSGSTSHFDYDKAGNRIAQEVNGAKTQATYNVLNQLLYKEQGGTTGMTHFIGAVNKPSVVTVGGTLAKVDPLGNFDGAVELASGTNNVSVVAVDANKNTNTKSYQVVATTGSTTTLTYDANGNLLNDGIKTYEWDAVNRLIAINYTGTSKRTEFSYDPLGRRSRIVEKTGDTESEKDFAWNGLELCEERDSSNTVTKRYYSQGMEVVSGSNIGSYYYTRDHLGSVRELLDNVGVTRARYSYDVWGNRSGNFITINPLDVDFGFTGHYYHTPSALCLAPYRAYDPKVGRWISRDLLGERGGLNLYGYVLNQPTGRIDPLGLWQVTVFGGSGFGGYVSFGYNSGQFNATVGAGAGAGLSLGLDLTDSGRRPCGWGAGLTVAGGIGEGFLGGSFQAQSDSNQGDSMSLGGRLGWAGGSINGQQSPGAPSTQSNLSVSAGAANYGASVFGGGTVSWASH